MVRVKTKYTIKQLKIITDPNLYIDEVADLLGLSTTTIQIVRQKMRVKCTKTKQRIYTGKEMALIEDCYISATKAAAKIGIAAATVYKLRRPLGIRFKRKPKPVVKRIKKTHLKKPKIKEDRITYHLETFKHHHDFKPVPKQIFTVASPEEIERMMDIE